VKKVVDGVRVKEEREGKWLSNPIFYCLLVSNSDTAKTGIQSAALI
jgi:hypothetical protein